MERHRSRSPSRTPWDMPQLTDEELDFDDPPPWLKNQYTRIFWYINRKVRDIVMEYGVGRPVFFCFHNSFCQYQYDPDPNVAKARIDNHLLKKPYHNVNLNQWRVLADEIRKRREQLRDRRGSRSPSPRGGGRRQHSPLRGRFLERSSSQSQSPSDTRSRSPRDTRRWSPGDRSPRQSRSPRRSHSPRNMSPRAYRDRRHMSPSISPTRRGSSPSRTWSKPPLPSQNRPKIPTNSSRRTYSSRPGAGIGRYNSLMDRTRDPTPRQENRVKEWVCKPQGKLPGCSMIFHNQEEYSNHINHRELNKGCAKQDFVCKPVDEAGFTRMPGCRRSFPNREEYEAHITERDRSRRCPLPRRPSAGSPGRVKKEGGVKSPLYKGPTTEITIADSPPYETPESPSYPDIAVSPSRCDPPVSPPKCDPPVSPPRCDLVVSPPRAEIAVSPPRTSPTATEEDNQVKYNKDGVLLFDDVPEKPPAPLPDKPRLQVKSNIFKEGAEPTLDQSPSLKVYPSVQRSPSHSPEMQDAPLLARPRVIRSPPSSPKSSVPVSLLPPVTLPFPFPSSNIPSASPGAIPATTLNATSPSVSDGHSSELCSLSSGTSRRDPRMLNRQNSLEVQRPPVVQPPPSQSSKSPQHRLPQVERSPQYSRSPQVERSPQYQKSPQVQISPQYQKSPQYRQSPQYQQAPQYKQSPQYQQSPQVERPQQYQISPRPQSSQIERSPQNQTPTQVESFQKSVSKNPVKPVLVTPVPLPDLLTAKPTTELPSIFTAAEAPIPTTTKKPKTKLPSCLETESKEPEADSTNVPEKKSDSNPADQMEMLLDKKKRGGFLKEKITKPSKGVSTENIGSSSKATSDVSVKKKISSETDKIKDNKTVGRSTPDFLSAISQGDKALQEKQAKKKSHSIVKKLDKKPEKRKYIDKEKSTPKQKDNDDHEAIEPSSKKVKERDTHFSKEKDKRLGEIKKGDTVKSVADKSKKKDPVKNNSDKSAEKQVSEVTDIQKNKSEKDSNKSRKEATKVKKTNSVSDEGHSGINTNTKCDEGDEKDLFVNTPEEIEPSTKEQNVDNQKSTDFVTLESNENESEPVKVINEQFEEPIKDKSTIDSVSGLDLNTSHSKLIEESYKKLDFIQANLITPVIEDATGDETAVDIPNINEEESSPEKFGFMCETCERTFLDPNQLNEHLQNCTDTRLDEGSLRGINNDSHIIDDDDDFTTDDESAKYPGDIPPEPLETPNSTKPLATKNSSKARLSSPTITSDDEPMDEYVSVVDNRYSGRVTTLRKALGAESDTEDEADDDTVILRKGVDSLDVCPRCKVQLETSGGNVSFDISDFSMILICINRECRVRVKIMNAMGQQQKMMLTCGL